jgi:hypothetical protein
MSQGIDGLVEPGKEGAVNVGWWTYMKKPPVTFMSSGNPTVHSNKFHKKKFVGRYVILGFTPF